MRREERKRFLSLAIRAAIVFIVVVGAAFVISRFFLSDFSDTLLEATLSDALTDTREMGELISERLNQGFISPTDRARISQTMDKYGFIYIVAADKDGGVVFNMGLKEAKAFSKYHDIGIFPRVLTGQNLRIPVYDAVVLMPDNRYLHAGIPQEGLTPELAKVTDMAGNVLGILFALALGLISVAVTYVIVMLRRVKFLRSEMERQSRLVYLGEIAGSLAHEIRNPLNTINMNVQLLEEQLANKDEKTVGKIHRVRNEVIRLDNILTSFLRFARPPKLSLKKVDVKDVIMRIEDFFGPEVEGAGIHLEVDIPDDLPPINGDKEQLRQLFLNLLLNARDATGRGGKIKIKGWKTPRRVHVSIEDDGCGIDKKELENIFEPYVTSKEEGTGVGLAIVRRIIMDHGGSIRVESAVGKGTKFTVSLSKR